MFSNIKINKVRLISLIVIFLLVVVFLLRIGFVYDEYGGNYGDGKYYYVNYLWYSFLSLLFLIITSYFIDSKKVVFDERGNKKITITLFFNILCFIALALSIFIIVDAQFKIDKIITYRDNTLNSFINDQVFSRIDLEELDNMSNDNQINIVYIRRSDCYICKKIQPDLEEYLMEENLKISYYDTAWDRESRMDYLETVLNEYKIQVIPAIVIIEDGKIITLYQGENVVEGLKDYIIK